MQPQTLTFETEPTKPSVRRWLTDCCSSLHSLPARVFPRTHSGALTWVFRHCGFLQRLWMLTLERDLSPRNACPTPGQAHLWMGRALSWMLMRMGERRQDAAAAESFTAVSCCCPPGSGSDPPEAKQNTHIKVNVVHLCGVLVTDESSIW